MYDIFKCVKAEVYHNTRKLTPAQIMKEKGCTHIIGGYYFNNNSKSKDYFKPFGWLIVDSEIVSTNQYRDWGFGCDAVGAPKMTTDRTKPYFMSGRPLLKDGAETIRTDTSDVARKAERQAVGWTKDGYVILWCDKTKMFMPDLIEKMASLGAVDALAEDGGGSVQGIFPNGKITSSRKMPSFLLLWGEKIEYEPKGEKPMVEINAYSLKKDGDKQVAKNFKVKEFACKDGSDVVFIAQTLPMVLQYIRMRTGSAVVINSAYRTVAHNSSPEVGGAEHSQHLYGTAADIKVSGYTPAKLATIAREIMPDWGGVGVYSWGIHVDVREEKADWNG